MRYAMKSFWILFFVIMALALGRCGRLSNSSKDIARPDATLFIPDGWNGEGDWEDNALKVEDITP